MSEYKDEGAKIKWKSIDEKKGYLEVINNASLLCGDDIFMIARGVTIKH